uniref:Uncharacterized protein n=1 Tax=Panagrolaimus superbus TaxID=310955 RepID=A0A914ZAI1_9BILA
MTHRSLALLSIFAVILTVWCHSHEAPHLKYSKEINEKAKEEVSSGHVHSHSHSHHDHDHSDCGHDHHHHEHHEEVHDHHHEEIHVHGHSHHHHQHADESKNKFIPYDKNSIFAFLNDPKTRLWTYSIGSTVLISAVPFLILTFIPIQANTNESGNLLKVLLAFGAGGLLGDAFLHLIPHASGGHDHHSHSHNHHHHHHGEEEEGHVHDMSVGFWVLGGLLTFFIVEKFVRIVRGEDEHCHSHGHSHGQQTFSKPNPPPVKKAKLSADESDDEKSDKSVKKDKELKKRPVKKETIGERRASMHVVEKKEEVVPRIRVAAYLNLAADFMHNFTDGLAIGASYIAGPTVGMVTMWTVLFHEVPHEIGDFAILIQSGYSKRRAMFTQLLTAFGALAGCIISLWSVDAYALAEAAQSSWVLPFTAGGFIYIAAVSVLPELLEKSSFLLSIFEVVALGAGVFSMYLVALYE